MWKEEGRVSKVEPEKEPNASLPAGARTGGPAEGLPPVIVAGRYTILGPMSPSRGTNFRAQDTKLGEIVALKYLPSPIPAESDAAAHFSQVSQRITRLNHRNIAQVFQVGEWEGKWFVVTEFVDGGSLAEFMEQRKKLTLATALEILIPVGRALSYSHRHGVVHRNLKPSNILLSRDGTPKICDFTFLPQPVPRETLASEGLAGFVSPELQRNDPNTDHRTDIYSWGALLYWVLTGKNPLLWEQNILPRMALTVIRKCLQNIEDRYFSMDEALGVVDAEPAGLAISGGSSGTDFGCAHCEALNPADARYCRRCGAGLFDRCPRCGAEDRVPLRTCPDCGFEPGRHQEFQRRFLYAKSLASQAQYPRAVQELEAALSRFGEDPEARAALEEYRLKASSLSGLSGEFKALADSEQYEAALSKAKEILRLNPNHEDAKRFILEAHSRIVHRDAQKQLEEARELAERKLLVPAIEAAERATRADPTNAEARAFLDHLMGKKAQYDSAVQEGLRHLETKAFEQAILCADSVLSEWPYAPAQEIRRQAENALKDLQRHLLEAQSLLQSRRFGRAIAELTAARGIRRDDEVSRLIRLARARRRRWFFRIAAVAIPLAAGFGIGAWAALGNRALLKQGTDLLLQGRFAEAERALLDVGVFLVDTDRVAQLLNLCAVGKHATRMREIRQWTPANAAWAKLKRESQKLKLEPLERLASEEIQKWRDRVSETLLRAESTRRERKWQDAVAAFQEALELSPNDDKAAAGLAETKESWYADFLQQAQDAFRARQWDRALSACDEALKIKPQDERALELQRSAIPERAFDEALERSRALAREKQWHKAVQACQDALRIKPGHDEGTRTLAGIRQSWHADAMQRANSYRSEKRFDKAIDTFREALLALPEDQGARNGIQEATQAWYLNALRRAEGFLQAKAWDQAVAACEEALRIVPDSEQAQAMRETAERTKAYELSMERARIYAEGKDWKLAVQHYENALGLRPEDPVARARIGELRKAWYDEAIQNAERLAGSAQWKDAEAACEEALRALPEDRRAGEMLRKLRDARVFRETLNEARVARAAKEWARAVAAYEIVAGLKPDDPDVKAELEVSRDRWYGEAMGQAKAYLDAREWKKAAAACADALRARPGDEAASRMSATAMAGFLDQKYDAAIVRAREALVLADWKGARAAAEEALQAHPGDAEATMILAEAKAEGKRTLVLDPGRNVRMDLVWIQPGTFSMGATEAGNNQGVRTKITKGFWMQRTEVTQEQFELLTGYNPSYFRGDPRRPVDRVSWTDCRTFLDRLKESCSESLRGAVPDLPTEAEWEYACRAGSSGKWCFGNDAAKLDDYAWWEGTSGGAPKPVGLKEPNAWGLFDMHGNVWEWCKDWYARRLIGGTDPQGPRSGVTRVLRGGSWAGTPDLTRSSYRWSADPASRQTVFGFRIVLRPPEK